MNAPTIIAALIVLVVFAAIVGKGIYNRRHGKGGCSCGGDCGACGGGCHCGEHPSFLTSGSPAPPGGRRRSIPWN